MSKIDWDKVSDNPEVISMIKQIRELELKVMKLDPGALIEHSLQVLSNKAKQNNK